MNLDTWEPRQANRKDFYDFVKVLDALPNVHMMMGFPYFGFSKVPEPMQLLESNAGKIRNSSKVQLEGSVFDNHKWNIEMARAVGLDILLFVNPGAPLTYYKEHADLIIACVEADVPLHFTCGTLAGATGPATIAGSIISGECEQHRGDGIGSTDTSGREGVGWKHDVRTEHGLWFAQFWCHGKPDYGRRPFSDVAKIWGAFLEYLLRGLEDFRLPGRLRDGTLSHGWRSLRLERDFPSGGDDGRTYGSSRKSHTG